MSRFNPAAPFSFSYEVWRGDRQVVVAICGDETVGYFTQGEDGQWWWFAYTDDGDKEPEPMAASNLMQVIAMCHELNANGWGK